MAVLAPTRNTTLAETFSFYVPSSDARLLEECANLADAVTVKGPNGPAAVSAMRASRDWKHPVIFDRTGYDTRVAEIDANRWFDAQAKAGADRLLTAGTWVPWDDSGEALQRAAEQEHKRVASWSDATVVFAIDHRWLTRAPMDLARILGESNHPSALVLAHRTDPLSSASAVHGLVAIVKSIPAASLLRTDHGGLGAIAFGASHAAIGLTPSYRHFVPPGGSGGGKPGDRSARVFIRKMMDWFTAETIAGWGTMAWELRCCLSCCDGQRLDRFFDPRLETEASVHNRTTLAQLADEILNAPRDERRRLFADICTEAIDHYGTMGKLSMVTKPKDQLCQWALV